MASSGRTYKFEPLFITALIILDDAAIEGLAQCSALSATQYRILLKAHELGVPANLGKVAASLSINSNTASRAVSQMVDQGLLTKMPSTEDGRKVYIRETEAGARELAAVDAFLADYLAHEFSTVHEEERDAIYAVIETMGRVAENASAPQVSLAIPSSFLSTCAQVRAELTTAVKKHGRFSLTDFRVLQKAADLGAAASVSAVAGELLLPVNTVTWTLGRLEEDGLVERRGDEADQRVVRIALTRAGVQVLKRVQDRLDAFLEVMYEAIGDEGMALARVGSNSLVETKRMRAAGLGEVGNGR